MYQSIMNCGRASPPFGSPPFQDTFSQGSADGVSPEEADSRKRLYESKANEAQSRANEADENISSSRISKLARMMNDPQFAFLSGDEQSEIRRRWFEECRK
jgi:hypothetical protein